MLRKSLIDFFLVVCISSFSQNINIDSIKLILNNTIHDSTRINLYINLGDEFRLQNSDTALKYYTLAAHLSNVNLKKLAENSVKYKIFSRLLASAYNNIGVVYNMNGDYKKAKDYLINSLKLIKIFDDKKIKLNAYNNLGQSYLAEGDISKTLDYFDKSLKLSEEIDFKEGIAIAANNIAYVYSTQGDHIKSLNSYQKSLKIYKEINNKEGISTTLNNIGTIYKTQKNMNKALDYFKQSLKIQEEIHDKEGIANSLGNIGSIFRDLKDYPAALDYSYKSLKINTELGSRFGIALSLNKIGVIYLDLKNHKKALEFCNQSLKLGQELELPRVILNASNALYKASKAAGKHQSALENYELYIKMRDSLNNIETQKATIKQQTQYEYEKKKALADKDHELQLKQQEEQAAVGKQKQNIIIASVSIVLLIVALFSVFLYNRFKVTQKQKAIIELKEKETHAQKEIIEEKHKEITDSINYAERIQRSFLATKELLNENLKEYFILFKPKDVVSGDFYWASKLNNGNFAFVTADSTGHGVPGAIMSLLNITSLEKAIEKETSPDKILNHTRKTIIERLKKDGSAEGGKDGMDATLVVLNKERTKLICALANNPVWILRNNEILVISPDKMPVGKHDKDQIPFIQHEIDLEKGDIIYALTDGMPDQFGGPNGKKYKYAPLKEFLKSISSLPMTLQKEKLKEEFDHWKGNLEQIDDVTIVGVRV